jgi:hypothetical protein
LKPKKDGFRFGYRFLQPQPQPQLKKMIKPVFGCGLGLCNRKKWFFKTGKTEKIGCNFFKFLILWKNGKINKKNFAKLVLARVGDCFDPILDPTPDQSVPDRNPKRSDRDQKFLIAIRPFRISIGDRIAISHPSFGDYLTFIIFFVSLKYSEFLQKN